MKRLFRTLLLIVIASKAYAQLTVNGEFRTRSILNHGYKMPVMENANPILSIDQRSRLSFNYTSKLYDTRLTLQNAHIWGGDDMYNATGTEGNSYALGVYEAWVNLKVGSHSYLKVGRQEWNYDDMRILSWRNWWTSGTSYDGLLYQLRDTAHAFDLDLGLSYNNNGTYTGALTEWDISKIKSYDFLHMNKKLGANTTVAIMVSLTTKIDTSANEKQRGIWTDGLFINHNVGKTAKGGFFAMVSAYYQHGTDTKKGPNGENRNISAYLFAAQAGYRLPNKKLEASLGAELISGEDYSESDSDYYNTKHTFDLLYGGRFPYYGGNMNHFLVQDSYSVGTKGGGYFDPYIKLSYKLNKKNIVNTTAFFPMLSTKVKAHTSIDRTSGKPSGLETDANGGQIYWTGSLGNYFDIDFTHKFNKDVILKTGFSYGLVSDTKNQMAFGYADVTNKTLNDLGNQYFGWVMLIVKPTFFKGAK